MDMQTTVCCLQFEICDGVVELDVDQALPDGLVDHLVLVSLKLSFEKIHLKRALWSIAIVERDSNPPR